MGSYIIDLYHRASTNKTLTARERAMLKAVQGAVIGVLIAVLPQLLTVLSGKAAFSFSTTAVDAILGALFTGLVKLWSTQGPEEAMIGQVIESYMQAKLEADAPGSTALANNWQAIQFTVPVQPRPVAKTPATMPVMPARQDQTWPPTPQYPSATKPTANSEKQPGWADAFPTFPPPQKLQPMPSDAGHSGSINIMATDKNASVTSAMPPAPQAPLYPTYNAPPAPAPHVSDMATGIIPTVNFTPPTQQP